ncbi:DNA polymerase-3 subunit epsilon [Nocardiopsis arvandica]|uniref:DNA polymerase-3 subunit epsilon n=1 Tax=Nocardiopsis sinuspersici TaxID=501010 RepID=A0A7Y9XDL7_9ACTN|nr:3'-5' exonuclease [Nocardiopsis sinuspersici]NYH53874.1 DNA polymerase-3 subunit epsilon [Nocardiopsis sinuspersici]
MGTLRAGALTRRRVGMRAADLEYAVLDMETTGLDPNEGARIVEIAVVRVRGDGKLVEEFSTLVDPRAPVGGREFHGISESDTTGAPTIAQVVPRLAGLLSDAVVVSHNLDFEQRFLGSELAAAGLPTGQSGLCALRALRSQVDLERYSLPKASFQLSGDWPTGQHTALGDARACAKLLAEMLTNAPGELRYDGRSPKRFAALGPAPGTVSTPVRWKPRTASVPGGLQPLSPWRARWRPHELDPALCGGAFGATDRAAAEAAARRDTRFRERLATVAAVTGGIAATAAGGLLVRLAGGHGGGWPIGGGPGGGA